MSRIKKKHRGSKRSKSAEKTIIQLQKEIQKLEKEAEDRDSTIHEIIGCSIHLVDMIDPVITSDGQTYERNFIEEWFESGSILSPNTNAPLVNTTLIPNIRLRNLIQSVNKQ